MKKILVCLDGSSKERGVLDAAIALGGKFGAKLTLFRSVGIQVDMPTEAYAMAINDIPLLLAGHAKTALTSLMDAVPPELRGSVRVDIGNPWQSIELAATDEDVDLIVIGSHGYQTLDRMLGTNAAKVVNHADRAVLVVRAPERLVQAREAGK